MKTSIFVTPLTLLLFAAPAHAQPLELETERVVIFKDGYGLFVKLATGVADADGRVYTSEVPAGAIMGTFWATPEKQRLLSMRAEWIEETTEKKSDAPAGSLIELLTANVGLEATLTVFQPDRATTVEVSAKIAEVLEAAQLLVIESDKGKQVLPVSNVRTLQARGMKTRVSRTSAARSRSKRLTFELGKSAARQPVRLRIMYFSEGVRWIPTYRASGELDSSAVLSLQAEIIDEVEPIRDATIDLVAGAPSFRFKHVVSPLSLEQNLRQTLAQVIPALSAEMMSNAMFSDYAGQQQVLATGKSTLNFAPEAGASQEQDLFVHHAGNFSLEVGARATVPLWEATTKVRHLYTLDLDMAQGAGGQKKPIAENSVVHQLELWNESGVPWTTGPALIIRGAVPLAQDLLAHTPPGSRAMLPVTAVPFVRGTYRERELNREANALKRNGISFTLIRREGTVTLSNQRSAATTVRLNAVALGRVDEASQKGQVTLNAIYDGINRSSNVSWEVTLQPGESKTLTYKSTVFANSASSAYRSVESSVEDELTD